MRARAGTLFTILTALGFTLAGASASTAQYLKHPDPKTPRLPDGSPNMTAPAPAAGGRKTGSGRPVECGGRTVPDELEPASWDRPPFTPWAAALFKERQQNEGRDRPAGRCLPHTIPDAMLVPAIRGRSFRPQA